MFSLPENPSLEQLVQYMMERRIADLHVSMPARVVRYDPSLQQADVEPLIQRVYADGSSITLPVITNVPVVHPRAGVAIIHFPLAIGDTVQLIFSERSLDAWKSRGGVTHPQDVRKNSLSDAIAIPGGYPFTDPATIVDPEALTIKMGNAELRLSKDGTINFGTGGVFAYHAARAENVEARLSALEQGLAQLVTDLTTFTTVYTAHTHIVTAPGSPTGPAVAPAIPPTPFVADTSVVASDHVRVD